MVGEESECAIPTDVQNSIAVRPSIRPSEASSEWSVGRRTVSRLRRTTAFKDFISDEPRPSRVGRSLSNGARKIMLQRLCATGTSFGKPRTGPSIPWSPDISECARAPD